MGTQTNIDNLSNEISKEDMDLVDSILGDLNKKQGVSSDRREEIIEKQRMLEKSQDQQMQQMQMPIQQRSADTATMPTMGSPVNPVMMDQATINRMDKGYLDNIIDMIKSEFKNIILVIILAFLINTEQFNSILNYYSGAFAEGTKDLTIQGNMLKSLTIGVAYFLIKIQM